MQKRMTKLLTLLSAAVALLVTATLGWFAAFQSDCQGNLVRGMPQALANHCLSCFVIESAVMLLAIGIPLLALHVVSRRVVVTNRIKCTVLW